MDNHQTQVIVHQFLQYLGERNLSALTGLFSETVDWYIPGDEQKAPWLGRRNSKPEVRDFYERLWQGTEPLSANIEKILIENNYAVITGEFATKMLQTGKTVASLFCIQITLAHGLIVKYRLLEDSHAVSVALTV